MPNGKTLCVSLLIIILNSMRRHAYIWFVLVGYLCIFTPSSSSIQYDKNPNTKSGESALDSKIGTTIHKKSPTSSSSPDVDLLSCQDLDGDGSLNTTCLLRSQLNLNSDLYVYGTGNLEILPYVSVMCLIEGCTVAFNLSGYVNIGHHATVVAGAVVFSASNLRMEHGSSVNTTSLGGLPPPQTSGVPAGYEGAGGGHGGRGASCWKNRKKNVWGGDVYGWSSLQEPWSYGSKGGRKSPESQYGGNGGGRVRVAVTDVVYVNGFVTADGGFGGSAGGGGSGGSIFVQAGKLKGYGTISAAGGTGWGGGGGGRISLDCRSIQDDLKISVQGGLSIGCPENGGAAGTYFNADSLTLRVGNDNVTTETETIFLDFPSSPFWSHATVENNARVLAPLLWSRIQVRGQISLYRRGSIIFGLGYFPMISEFELVAEELLMSDSTIKVFGELRVTVKKMLMWNSKIDQTAVNELEDGKGFVSHVEFPKTNLVLP